MLFFKKNSDIDKNSWSSVQESSLSSVKSESDLTEGAHPPASSTPKSAAASVASPEDRDMEALAVETSAIETQVSLPSSSLGMCALTM